LLTVLTMYRAETIRSALEVLAVCTVIPKAQLHLCEQVRQPDSDPVPAIRFICGFLRNSSNFTSKHLSSWILLHDVILRGMNTVLLWRCRAFNLATADCTLLLYLTCLITLVSTLIMLSACNLSVYFRLMWLISSLNGRALTVCNLCTFCSYQGIILSFAGTAYSTANQA